MRRSPLSPDGATEYLLTQWGLKRGRRRLQELRGAKGGGPWYHRVGNEVLYFPDDLDEWAEAQLGAALRSTTEERALRLLNQPTPESIEP
jgi:hypothetical protein